MAAVCGLKNQKNEPTVTVKITFFDYNTIRNIYKSKLTKKMETD